jgi:hypothetical protein
VSAAEQNPDRRLKLVAGTDVPPLVDEPYDFPEEIWPGRQSVNQAGAKLAVEMLLELHSGASDDVGISARNYCDLGDWARQGRPFRNIIREFLHRAQLFGADAETGFCAVLTDFVAAFADPDSYPADTDTYINAYLEVQP